MKKILIFGITGTIGEQTLEIIKLNPAKFDLVGFTFFNNLERAIQIKKDYLQAQVFSNKNLEINESISYEDLIIKTKPDLIVNAVSGFPGLEISFLAVKHQINMALANKETIAICGNVFLKQAANKIKIFPIDSEISALYELIQNHDLNNIKKIIITASGGRYYLRKNSELINEDYDSVIKHPVWNMGARISIDSSTMINKFFEMIEAFHFFKKPVEVLYHPQAIIHAGILKNNHGYSFQFSKPSMKYSINLALNEFEITNPVIEEIDFTKTTINLELIDEERWKPIKWARNFINNNLPAIPVIVNALDEELINLFKSKKIDFLQITEIIERYLKKYQNTKINNYQDILELDKIMRKLLSKEFSWLRN